MDNCEYGATLTFGKVRRDGSHPKAPNGAATVKSMSKKAGRECFNRIKKPEDNTSGFFL
jgi:hypothetical protein